MARRDWGVCSEDASLSYAFEIPFCGLGTSLPVHQFQSQEACMAFIHVKPLNPTIAQSTKHSDAADSEDDLLTSR